MSPFRLLPLAAPLVVAVAATPLVAQKMGSTGFQLVKSVKDNDAGAFYQITREGGGQLNSAVLDYQSDGETALHVAVRTNRRNFVNDLLYFGASPQVVSAAGETPLTMAVIARNTELVDLLIRARAQVDFANRRGETPLIKAVQVHDIGLVQQFLERGANPDKTDFTGQSARMYAAADTRYPAISKALADAPKRTARPVSGPKLN